MDILGSNVQNTIGLFRGLKHTETSALYLRIGRKGIFYTSYDNLEGLKVLASGAEGSSYSSGERTHVLDSPWLLPSAARAVRNEVERVLRVLPQGIKTRLEIVVAVSQSTTGCPSPADCPGTNDPKSLGIANSYPG